MKTFRKIQLLGSRAQIAAFREKLTERVPTAAWRRNVDLRGSDASDVTVFEYTGEEAPGGFVWLFDEPGGARVTNIVPKSAGSLSHLEYNTIATCFVHDVLNPVATQTAVEITVGPSAKSIEDLLPASVAAALRRFSTSANRATGNAHPHDAEKWDEFVILAHEARVLVAPDTLWQLLVEDEGWNDEQALNLAVQYEGARRLLDSNTERTGVARDERNDVTWARSASSPVQMASPPQNLRTMSWHITDVSFENYRTFEREERLALRPLTVLIGKNSSGKSAIARLPLLLRRALSPDAEAPLELEFEGHDFGASFLDLVHNRVPTRGITLGVTVSNGARSISLRGTVGYWDEYRLQGVRSFQLRENGRTVVELEWNKQGEPIGDGLVYSNALSKPGTSPQALVQFKGLLPVESTAWSAEEAAVILHEHYPAIREAFTNLVYLGPFRDAPPREMRLPESAVRDVGLRGGHAARALANDMLRHGSSVLKRVGDWYRDHLGGWTLDLVREGQSFSVVLHPPSDPTVAVNLLDAGVGLSQVLPVVVQHELDRASGRAGGLHIIEQPELHLHPGAHGDLADLYIDAVGRGMTRYLIETHAENFVLRIRRRIAEGTLRRQDVAVYWIDNEATAGPRVRPIGIDERGNVDFWPKGVFSEDLEEVKAIRAAQRDGHK